MHICFLSNGYGEDRSAALIAGELMALSPGITVSGAPLITRGEEYEKHGIPVVTRGRVPPSGGFPTLSAAAFLRDLTYNRRHIEYYRDLKPIRKKIDAAMVVRDTFLLALSHVSLRKEIIHISLSKSDYKNSHFWFEESVFRRIPRAVLTRDEHTCRNLRKKGINTRYLGNPIMDDLAPNGVDLGPGRIVGILPGSKSESYENFRRVIRVIHRIAEDVDFVCALPAHLETKRMTEAAAQEGWDSEGGVLSKGRQRLRLMKGAFTDVITQSEVLISLAGTATEQAAGLGKPVVSFTGCGTQSNTKRMKNQERLLGGAVKYVTAFPDGVAAEVSRLLADPDERNRRGEAGKSRMGAPGASRRIAAFLIEEFRIPARPGIPPREE